MSKVSHFIEVIAIVEGKTEQIFIEKVLAPYLERKNIYIYATQVTKPGQKGGNVCFERVKKDLEIHLKQRSDTFVTTMIDYYGVKEWPGTDQVPIAATPAQIAKVVNDATSNKVNALLGKQSSGRRFIPYVAVHEFEALLFSDSAFLAAELKIPEKKIKAVLDEYGEPEAINNGPRTAPSKRLDKWSANGKFPKTTKGIEIARLIGISQMREKCPLFNSWLERLEELQTI